MTNFADKKTQFESMKKKSAEELKQMYLNDELQSLFTNWQKGLELQIPQGTEVEESLLAAFNQEKQTELKEIEGFLQIVHDWIDETTLEVEASGVSKSHEQVENPQKRASIEKLQRANEEAQQRMEQQRLAADNARKKQYEIMMAQKKREQEENEAIAKQIEDLAEEEDLLAGLEECAK